MVVKINRYLATIRFREASLTKLENSVDDVHHLAKQVGLVAGSLQVDPLLMSARPARQAPLVVLAVALLRISSLLAATYLGGQYFVRYSPLFIRSNLPQLVRDVFALEQTVEPSDETLPDGAATSDFGGWLEESLFPLLPPIFFSLPYLALTIVLLSDLHRCRSANIKLRPLKPTQLLYEEYFGIEGKLYSFKVALLQIFTVMLQAFGKLQIMGGLVSFAFHSAPKHSGAFERCFWAFVGFLCLNSAYPTILLAFPAVKWVRRGAAMMDAVLDIAYTSTYLIITLLAISELQLDQAISGNFGDEASVNFQAELDPAFAFPSDFLGFFAVFYSVAHVCTVCRALERSDWVIYWKKLQSFRSSASRSLLSPWGFSCSKRFRICGKALHRGCRGFRVLSRQFFKPLWLRNLLPYFHVSRSREHVCIEVACSPNRASTRRDLWARSFSCAGSHKSLSEILNDRFDCTAQTIAAGTAGPHLPAPDRSGHCRTSSASSGSEWALPDFICQLQIPVGTAGLQSRLPYPSGHCRASSASSRSQWALPDFNRELQIPVGAAGLQPRAPDPSGHCRASTASSRSQWALPAFNRDCPIAVGTAGLQPVRVTRFYHSCPGCFSRLLASSRSQRALPDFICQLQIAVGTAGLHPRAPDRSGHCRTSSASSRSQWALPDFIRELQIAAGTAGLHLPAPDLSGHCRTSSASSGTAGLQPRLPYPSGHCRTSTASPRSQCALPDFSRDCPIAVGTSGLQPVYMPN
eukprot:s2232_g10.t1